MLGCQRHIGGSGRSRGTVAPTRATVAKSADLADEVGTYSLAFDGAKGRVQDQGKDVVVWKKDGRAWKVAADIFNSNLPAAP